MENSYRMQNTQQHRTIRCPVCHTVQTPSHQAQASSGQAMTPTIRDSFVCACGAVVPVARDLRRHPRATVHLWGTLLDASTGTPLSEIVINSLSVHGVGFRMTVPRRVWPGTLYDLCFRLDDDEQSLLQERICIRRHYGPMIGATFYPEDQYHHALDFYLNT